MDHDALASLLHNRLRSHPNGVLGRVARMGAALHSEDLGVVDLIANGAQTPWNAERATVQDRQATPFGPEGDAPWRPDRFLRSPLYPLVEDLTLETFPATPFVHKKGGLYQGVAIAYLDHTPHAVYTDANGVWWIRPWAMFADGRFTRAEPQPTHWIGCGHPQGT
jgi:hypothetical protein